MPKEDCNGKEMSPGPTRGTPKGATARRQRQRLRAKSEKEGEKDSKADIAMCGGDYYPPDWFKTYKVEGNIVDYAPRRGVCEGGLHEQGRVKTKWSPPIGGGSGSPR